MYNNIKSHLEDDLQEKGEWKFGRLERMNDMVDKQKTSCPHCGQYCTGSSVFCLPPIDYEK